MRATGIDHYVLAVVDVERTLAWYADRLGLEPTRVDEWRKGDAPFPSLRVNDSLIIDVIPGPRAGENVDHICLLVDVDDLAAVAQSGRFDVVGGPSTLWGARGYGQGLYVRDPDGNVIELRHY
ncbi:MAG TPA: VOC family protein [Acidimicrobiales bacterium]|nr:VOC family protein [Acidimicrobiales bacterium]